MKTEILEFKDRADLLKALREWLIKDYVIVNVSVFFDQIDETHKAVINYYE